MVLNQQRRFAVDVASARAFVRRLRGALHLGQGNFNVCFVDDARMTELNARYRRKARPTDVLSFPWAGAGEGSRRGGQAALPPAVAPVYDRGGRKSGAHGAPLHSAVAPVGACPDEGRDRREVAASRRAGPRYSREFVGFLGDVVISVETARRNAREAGHSTAQEIRLLILHGALHLLGYDHETDQGEMTTVERSLHERLSKGKR